MLSRLLEVSPTVDLSNLEETCVRASNLLCKVHTYMHTHRCLVKQLECIRDNFSACMISYACQFASLPC